MQTRQLSTLDAGIRVTLAKMGDANAVYYARLLPHAYDFWKDYVADSGRENRTVELAILPDRTAVLPDDYTEYVMVGIRRGQYVQNLVHNGALTSLPVPKDELDFLQSKGLLPFDEAGALYSAYSVNETLGLRHDYLGYEGGPLFGYGYPGYGGEFRIDNKERRIICSTSIPGDGTLVLQYYALAPDSNDGWVINPLWDKALHLYLSWQFYVYVKKDMGMSAYFKNEYNQEKRRTADRTTNLSYDGIRAAMRDVARDFPR